MQMSTTDWLLFFVDVGVIILIFAAITLAFLGICHILVKRYDSVSPGPGNF